MSTKMACKYKTFMDLNITGELVNKSLNTFALSKRYVQIMLKCSILNILYRRMELDDSEFKTRKYGEVPFIVFKNKTVKHPLLKQYMSWKKAITDSIDKNYLKEIYIFIKDSNTENILETYNFRLKYDLNDKGTEYKPRLIHVKDATIQLLQIIYDLGKSDKLKSNTLVDIEFTYFPNTPLHYEPPGFEESLQPDCIKIKRKRHHLGTLFTSYHKLLCYGMGDLFEERAASTSMIMSEGKEEDEDEHNSGEDIGISTPLKDAPHKAAENKSPTITVLQNLNLKNKDDVIGKAQNNLDNSFNMTNITISDISHNTTMMTEEETENILANGVNCICQLITKMNVGTITCFNCKRMFHAPCHGFIQPFPKQDRNFRCINCNTTDRIIADFDKKDRPLLAKVRLLSYFLNESGELPQAILDCCAKEDKELLFQKLKKFKVYDVEKIHWVIFFPNNMKTAYPHTTQ